MREGGSKAYLERKRNNLVINALHAFNFALGTISHSLSSWVIPQFSSSLNPVIIFEQVSLKKMYGTFITLPSSYGQKTANLSLSIFSI